MFSMDGLHISHWSCLVWMVSMFNTKVMFSMDVSMFHTKVMFSVNGFHVSHRSCLVRMVSMFHTKVMSMTLM